MKGGESEPGRMKVEMSRRVAGAAKDERFSKNHYKRVIFFFVRQRFYYD